MNIDIHQLSPQQCYQYLVSAILPRPIAWISTQSAAGLSNLAPFSFFSVASVAPPVLSVTQVNPRDRAEKDTVRNLRETGNCVVNIVNQQLAAQMNASCADYPANVSEFSAVGIEPIASQQVPTPGVALSPVRFECRLRDIIAIGEGPQAGQLVLLDVVHLHIDDTVLEQGRILPDRLDAIGKLGGDDYSLIRERFQMTRPQAPATPLPPT
ncbi:flavin reductase family protein [Parachitinimonas caeni]|uniref:Flavin reductase family protein n=1 Tax=Parachitinimonas caeni TaxID=3031301 RepID=A0ABT7DUW0_9NEIS|nr:flavin reductase family protein [Parachitinimonas caeni]MDK2123856.1 flavin reductase family protein [Parachitinimonas caeni]